MCTYFLSTQLEIEQLGYGHNRHAMGGHAAEGLTRFAVACGLGSGLVLAPAASVMLASAPFLACACRRRVAGSHPAGLVGLPAWQGHVADGERCIGSARDMRPAARVRCSEHERWGVGATTRLIILATPSHLGPLDHHHL